MKKFFLPTVAITVSLFALMFLAPSGACAGVGTGAGSYGKSHKTQKDETYMVIKITDENKSEDKVTYKAIPTSRFKDEKKHADDEFNNKKKEWHDLKLTDPTAPMPKKIKIQKIQGDYETNEYAQKEADKLTDAELNKDTHKTKVEEKK
jgi:hypothetical protein